MAVNGNDKAIPPHFPTKVRGTEFYGQIEDLDKIRECNWWHLKATAIQGKTL
ncbi:MAG: hypothetical protein WBE28_03120 [bacterium]